MTPENSQPEEITRPQENTYLAARWLRMGLVFNALLMIGCLIPYHKELHLVAQTRPVGSGLYGVILLVTLIAILGLSVSKEIFFERIWNLVTHIPKLGAWLGGLLFWLSMLRLGEYLFSHGLPGFVLLFYAWVLLFGVLIVSLPWKDAKLWQPRSNVKNMQAKMRWIVLIFFVLTLVRDAALLRGFGIQATVDSFGYIQIGRDLFSPLVDLPAHRNLAYPFLNAATSSADNPWPLMWLQILSGALAVAAIVKAVGKHEPALAIWIGVFLTLDVVWGSANRRILTEGPTASFSLLSSAMVISHFGRKTDIRWWELSGAGLLYGYTAYLRPSNVPLALIVLAGYIIFLRPRANTLWVAGGVACILFSAATFNGAVKGNFSLGGSAGVYLGFPLFYYDLFSPENGPASAFLDDSLQACDLDVDYRAMAGVRADRLDAFMWGGVFPCLSQVGMGDAMPDLLADSYKEAILKNPPRYILEILGQTSRFLATPVTKSLTQNLGPSSLCEGYNWCKTLLSSYRSPSKGIKAVTDTLNRAATFRTQIYLAMLPSVAMQNDTAFQGLVSCLMMICFLLVAARGHTRFVSLACALLVGYVSLTAVIGMAFVIRFTIPLSPFYNILSATTLVTILQNGVMCHLHQRPGKIPQVPSR